MHRVRSILGPIHRRQNHRRQKLVYRRPWVDVLIYRISCPGNGNLASTDQCKVLHLDNKLKGLNTKIGEVRD